MRKLVESPTDLYNCLLEVFRRAGCIVIIASMGSIASTTESLRQYYLRQYLCTWYIYLPFIILIFFGEP